MMYTVHVVRHMYRYVHTHTHTLCKTNAPPAQNTSTSNPPHMQRKKFILLKQRNWMFLWCYVRMSKIPWTWTQQQWQVDADSLTHSQSLQTPKHIPALHYMYPLHTRSHTQCSYSTCINSTCTPQCMCITVHALWLYRGQLSRDQLTTDDHLLKTQVQVTHITKTTKLDVSLMLCPDEQDSLNNEHSSIKLTHSLTPNPPKPKNTYQPTAITLYVPPYAQGHTHSACSTVHALCTVQGSVRQRSAHERDIWQQSKATTMPFYRPGKDWCSVPNRSLVTVIGHSARKVHVHVCTCTCTVGTILLYVCVTGCLVTI